MKKRTLTKKQIAIALDKANPLFNFSAESGLTSYKNYTLRDLYRIADQHAIRLSKFI